MPDEPTYQTDKLKNLTVAILIEAIHEAKKGKGSSAKWLATPYATSLAESVGFDPAHWSDIWSHFRPAKAKPPAKREPKAAFTRRGQRGQNGRRGAQGSGGAVKGLQGVAEVAKVAEVARRCNLCSLW